MSDGLDVTIFWGIGVGIGAGVSAAMELTTGVWVACILVGVTTVLSIPGEVQDIIASAAIARDKTMYGDVYRFPPIVTLPSYSD